MITLIKPKWVVAGQGRITGDFDSYAHAQTLAIELTEKTRVTHEVYELKKRYSLTSFVSVEEAQETEEPEKVTPDGHEISGDWYPDWEPHDYDL